MTKIIIFLLLFLSSTVYASPLKPIRLDSPRDTMSSYLEAMADYNNGRLKNNKHLKLRVYDAARTLNLEDIPPVFRQEKGKEFSIILKEIIDRIITIDTALIPDNESINKWRLKGTEIIIRKVESGPRRGDFLFSKDTVARIPYFYKRVQHLPFLNNINKGAAYRPPLHSRWIPSWAKENFLGLKKIQWLGIFAAIFIGFTLKLLVQFLIKMALRLFQKNENSLQYKTLKAIEKPIGLVFASGLWYFSTQILGFEGTLLKVLVNLTQILFSIGLIWATYRLIDVLTLFFHKIAIKTDSELDDQLVPLLGKSVRVFVLVIGFLVTIQNLGFNVMSLLAGLGLGGLAFALAAKDTAANLFGSIMILLDRPFKVGDWIVCDGAEGTVEEIGFRSTQVRTFYDSVISIPNMSLASDKIDNMGHRKFRRIKTELGLTYSTKPDKLEAFIAGIKKIIDENEYTRKDYYHVVFNSYGDFSLNILVYFFLATPDWSTELKEKQKVFLEIFKLADNLNVSFAFPTQSLHLESAPDFKLQT